MHTLRVLLACFCVLSVCASALPASAANRDNGIIMNETGKPGGSNSGVYLNPQFRYQGSSASDGSRLRTQRLKQNMASMAVGDFNGDGKNEVAILGDHDIAVFKWAGNGTRLEELGRTRVMAANDTFTLRVMDLDKDGVKDFVITTFNNDDNRPYSFFFSFRGNKFREIYKRCPYFVGVAKIPPYFTDTLVGQGWDSLKLFAPGVRVMEKKGDTFALGGRIDLPKDATCYNFTYIPPSRENPQPQLVVLTEDERLKVYQGRSSSVIHTTMERFSGSAVGMNHYKGIAGLGIDKNYQLPSRYYAPMNLIAADITRTGEPVLLVNKPISTASQVFDRYRYFPQGEIHALYWDGVGLALKWKTRRIRGSVAALDLGDVNNDGVLDLVVGLNTSPELGIGGRQCMLVAYPLDMAASNPNVPADMSDFEVNPNN